MNHAPGKVFVLEDWYFRGGMSKVIKWEDPEELGDGLLESYFSKSLHVQADSREISNASLEALFELPDSKLDLDFYECNFLETPFFPLKVQSCIFEESHDRDDVLRLLDGLANTDIRFLALLMHWSEPEPNVLAAKLRKLKNLEVLHVVYGNTWFRRDLESPMRSFPQLRLALVSAELLEEMRRDIDKHSD